MSFLIIDDQRTVNIDKIRSIFRSDRGFATLNMEEGFEIDWSIPYDMAVQIIKDMSKKNDAPQNVRVVNADRFAG